MRIAPVLKSPGASNVVSFAQRITPPGAWDCSGSHCFIVPRTDSVLTLLRASAPPIALTARLSRSSDDGVVAQEPMNNADKSRNRARFMRPPVFRVSPAIGDEG